MTHKKIDHYVLAAEELKAAIARKMRYGAVDFWLLAWQMGSRLDELMKNHAWGRKEIKRLADELKTAYPRIKFFSVKGLLDMRALHLASSKPDSKLIASLKKRYKRSTDG